jgi:hypothetical protein
MLMANVSLVLRDLDRGFGHNDQVVSLYLPWV